MNMSYGMLCIVSFLHVLEASIIDVTSVSGVGDGYCATLTAQSFYRMPAYKTYSCQKHVLFPEYNQKAAVSAQVSNSVSPTLL